MEIVHSSERLWYRNRVSACRTKIDRTFDEIAQKDFFGETIIAVQLRRDVGEIGARRTEESCVDVYRKLLHFECVEIALKRDESCRKVVCTIEQAATRSRTETDPRTAR